MATDDGNKSGLKTGCIIAAIFFGVVGLICAGIVTWGGWTLWHDPDVQHGIAVVGAAMGMVREAATAPGTTELRQQGCTQAMVFSPELIRRFEEAAAPDGGARRAPTVPMVICQGGKPDTVPSCEDVARTYAAAVSPPPPEMAITVQVTGRDPICRGVYGPDGSALRDVDANLDRTMGSVSGAAAAGGG